MERFNDMKLAFAFLLIAAVHAAAQVQPACGSNQNCPNGNQVPFPVINPVQGLANVLNLSQRNNQPPQPMSANGLAPVATPPPVLPPGINR